MGEKKPATVKSVQPPKGTRDLYPEDALRRRYITQTWRDAAIRCGFDEIEGPTLESSDLYSIKSGEGILSELFQVYSGKSDKEIEQVQQTGRAPYAMRPEFTPTLARMYAAHAKQLPKPCKWFTAGPYFRAERPQRGRLREFLQWNVDAIGLPSEDDTPQARAQMDAETIECCVRLLESLGLTTSNLRIKINDRELMRSHIQSLGVSDEQLEHAYTLLDKREKLPKDALEKLGIELALPERFIAFLTGSDEDSISADALTLLEDPSMTTMRDWSDFDSSIVRGLAYYTGTVFEAIADGERAVAGGGRYDNLIELMGGPPTPAVGFAMGDVVLANLLDDHDLFPTGTELMDAVSRPPASVRPDAFVVPNGDEANEPLAHQLASRLRRGVESQAWLARDDRKPWNPDRYRVNPLHARITYKSTRNLKKLRADAEKQHARFLIEIHAPDKVELTDMDKRESLTSDIGSFNLDPTSPHDVGRAIAERTR
jgi:histidyl-tRNA synthetase